LAAGPKEDVFCGIWRGLERAYVAYKDDRVLVIMDLYPLERGQALIVPREHFQYLLRDAWEAYGALLPRLLSDGPGLEGAL